MFDVISPDSETVTEQDSVIGSAGLSEAVVSIDAQFGGGYAKQHPILIGSFMLASAIVSTGAAAAQQAHRGLMAVASAITDGNLNEELKWLTAATSCIATAIEDK
jgi:hypothetical protein